MLHPVKTLKKSVHENPKPYIIASATAGIVVGVVLTRKFTPAVKINGHEILQEWVDKMDADGWNVYVLPKEFHDKVKNIAEMGQM